MTRALVLGGGGVAGIAWETGLLFGLAECGIDVSHADVVIGTSAGSTVGAQLLSGTSLRELYERNTSGRAAQDEMTPDVDPQTLATAWTGMLSQHTPGRELRAAIGQLALTAPTQPETQRRAVIERRLSSHEWPPTPLQIVVVEAESGDERVLTRDDGVCIVDAVAASCAVPGIWPPVQIEGRHYIDGGVRSLTNADLALGYEAVLVLAPVGDLIPVSPDIGAALDRLHEAAAVVTVRPDQASLDAIGMNPLDPATAAPAAVAGREQAARVADDIRKLWS